MRKFVFTTILALITFSGSVCTAQPEALRGTWISPEQDVVEILNTGLDSANYLSNKLLKEESFNLFILGDTLSFQQIYTSSFTQHKIEYTNRYDLKVVSVNDSILVIMPVSNFSKAYFQERSILVLKKIDYLVDKTIVFEKLIYHASSAWGGPTIALQVDSSKNLYMDYKNNTGESKYLQSGNYSAVLDVETYNELIYHLQKSNLRMLKFSDVKGKDSPIITLIVYFNGKRKYLKSVSPPRISKNLIKFINWRLRKYAKLKPTDEKMEIER
ncbi:hypothetical protein [Dyadobacter frigoris]|uniref:Uncharacterized protein n=1 Tax=Dyadobacter frigoris TaxID=2576211 RepID=A0A4U6D7H6_9BACT|nr:hypothetical protein [Dyadobacter frigoris]TKT92465.1 hypothetical protein FDK13_10890 [Dyadobacter frigoris]GLU55253.1 hypothetical protein Dfri01_47140 [Dyadobacter frigoris]